MKKVFALVLAFAMCLSLAACGTSGTATGDEAQAIVDAITQDAASVVGEVLPEAVPDITDATVPEADPAAEPETKGLPEGGDLCEWVEAGDTTYNIYHYYTEECELYIGISAVNNADGTEKWNYLTEPYYVGQLDNYTIVGPTTAGFVFTKEDVVYCLDPVDGSLEWKSEPMDIWPTGYFAIDDSCNFYFPGYFVPSLAVIGSDGSIVKKYDELESVYGYPVSDINGWCCGIRLNGDGNICIDYGSGPVTTYVVDPQTGCCVDEYPYTVSVAKEDLVGTWMDNYFTGSPNVILTIDDRLNYEMYIYNSDGSIMHTYKGSFQLDTFVEEVGNDWLVSSLKSTDDPAFADWSGIGDYVINWYNDGEDSGLRGLELVQINNGDSVLSTYFDMTYVILREVEPVG